VASNKHTLGMTYNYLSKEILSQPRINTTILSEYIFRL